MVTMLAGVDVPRWKASGSTGSTGLTRKDEVIGHGVQEARRIYLRIWAIRFLLAQDEHASGKEAVVEHQPQSYCVWCWWRII